VTESANVGPPRFNEIAEIERNRRSIPESYADRMPGRAPALNIEERFYAAVRRNRSASTGPKTEAVAGEISPPAEVKALRQHAEIAGGPADVPQAALSASEKPVPANEILLRTLLLRVIIPADPFHSGSGIFKNRPTADLIEAQAPGLRANAGVEHQIEPLPQADAEIKRMLRLRLGT
jgi:hypothetical protein